MPDRQDQHRTLQDDRAALEIDAEDVSPLVEGEGAPLAEDSVREQPDAGDVRMTPALLGGAPMVTVMPPEADRPRND